MFLADWSGRRVAAYALTWLVGFPLMMSVVATVAAVSEARGYARSATSTPAPYVADSMRARRDSIVRLRLAEVEKHPPVSASMGIVTPLVVTDTISFDAHGTLVAQPSDMSVSFDTEPIPAFYLWSWLLPPTLLVAAWTWTRRSRAEPE